jgi:MFS family permease
MSAKTLRYRSAGLIGNCLGHYDSALFGLLAPFIAPLFFGSQDPLTALILTYGIIPLGLVSYPAGALFFGWIGDRWGRRQTLFLSLIGMAAATASIGFLPTYKEAGMAAPLLLSMARLLQSFFAAGETTSGAIFMLEHTRKEERGVVSSFFDASTVLGILLASGLVTLLSEGIQEGWRSLFWAGGAAALFGFFLRLKTVESAEFSAPKVEEVSRGERLKAIGMIALAAGFSYTTYAVPFSLMNGLVPLVSDLEKGELMKMNTSLLFLDLLLLPLFGKLADRYGKEKIMLGGAVGSALVALPIFVCLEGAGLGTVIVARTAIVICGVAFGASYHAWAMEQISPHFRCRGLSIGYAIGTQIIGAPSAAISLWLFQKTEWIGAPGLYLLIAALGAIFSVSFASSQLRPALRARDVEQDLSK